MDNLERMNLAARAILGQPVIVDFRRPPLRGAIGETYKSPEGVIFIDIAPGQPAAEIWRIFTHELAHGRLHVASVPATPAQAMRPGAIPPAPPSDELIAAILDKREREADNLAAKWRAWTEERADPHLDPDDPWTVRLAVYLSVLKLWRGD